MNANLPLIKWISPLGFAAAVAGFLLFLITDDEPAQLTQVLLVMGSLLIVKHV